MGGDPAAFERMISHSFSTYGAKKTASIHKNICGREYYSQNTNNKKQNDNRNKKQAEREGGHILILPSEPSEEAGGLSGRTHDLPSASKDTTTNEQQQIKTEEVRAVMEVR